MSIRRLICVLVLLLAEGSAGARAGGPIEDLRSADVDVRRAAANAIRLSVGDERYRALPVMIDLLLKEKDGQVRLAMLDAVTALGPDAASAVPALLHTLRTDYGGLAKEELHQDYRSALALAAVGKPSVEGLRGLLKERKENVRAESIMALGRIGPDAEAAVSDLVPLLGDKSERIRREASTALGRIGEAASGPLIAASESSDAEVRSQALAGLGGISAPDAGSTHAVLKGTRDASPGVRASALKALARFRMPDESLVPTVSENLRHADEQVRLAVVNLMVGRPTLLKAMAPELGALLTGPDDGVSRHAAYLLGKVGPEAGPLLLGALPREESRIDQVAEALAQIGGPIVARLMQAAGDPDPRVRRGAALALGLIRPPAPGVVPKLTAGLGDPDPGVKAASLTAINNLGPRAEESVPAVRNLLRDESADIRLQVIAILFQSAPRDDRLLDDFTALLDDPDSRVQRGAIDTIRALGPPGRRSLPLVIGKLNGSQPEVRLAAAELIGSHGPAGGAAVAPLIPLLADPLPTLRTAAAQALGKIGRVAQPAFPGLSPLVDDPRAEVREAVATTLGSLELDAEALRPPLARALRDETLAVRRAAMKAVQGLGPGGAIFVPDIIAMAASPSNARTVDRMLRPFERTGPDRRSSSELVTLLDHKQEPVRLLAIKFLGLAGRGAEEALPALERLRDDPNAEVRKRADAACRQIRDQSSPAASKVRS